MRKPTLHTIRRGYLGVVYVRETGQVRQILVRTHKLEFLSTPLQDDEALRCYPDNRRLAASTDIAVIGPTLQQLQERLRAELGF